MTPAIGLGECAPMLAFGAYDDSEELALALLLMEAA